ncbi:MAG: hypothetical protein GY749_41895 [Desulfobacteraceae bacterium]|nr:hypothetical protein [Desulfobacteraceae bacterium]
MKLGLPEKTVPIHLSYVFDPFPDLMKWLEDICKDWLPSELTIDEEGYGKKLIAYRLPKDAGDSVLLKVYEWAGTSDEGNLLVKSEISKYVLIKSILNRLQSFSHRKKDMAWSSEYKLYDLPFGRVREHLKILSDK